MINVLFRVDDGPSIGGGHLMRCLALAEAVCESGGSAGLSTARPSTVHAGWRSAGAKVKVDERPIGSDQDLALTLAMADRDGADWLVVDGYGFSTGWLDAAAGSTKLLYMDDLGQRDAAARLVLNQNAGAETAFAGAYGRCGRALLGLQWFLLRSAWRHLTARPQSGRLLVTLGSEDPDNLAFAVMNCLIADGRQFFADVVVAAPDAGYRQAREFADRFPERFALHRAPAALPALMARASVTLCGGGITSVEAASLGLAQVILVLADNQLPGAMSLRSRGAAALAQLETDGVAGAARLALDLLGDDVAQRKMSRQGLAQVDGLGPRRVLEAML